jgi:general secretion pathway protein I
MRDSASHAATPDSASHAATRDGSSGFTLIEVLVAFVIAALALGVLYEGAAGGLRVGLRARRVAAALSHARSHLAALGAGALAAGEQSGDDGGGFRWRGRVTPLATVPLGGDAAGVSDARGPRLVLYGIAVRIDWDADGGPGHVTLDSERLGLAPPPPP